MRVAEAPREGPLLRGDALPARRPEALNNSKEKWAYGRERSGDHSPVPGNRLTGPPWERHHSAVGGGTRDRVRLAGTLRERRVRRAASGIVTLPGGELSYLRAKREGAHVGSDDC
jgi:hypothetical protein